MSFLQTVCLILVALAVSFCINLVLTHAIIWAVKGIFNIDWFEKFWHVFVALIIVQTIFGCARTTSK